MKVVFIALLLLVLPPVASTHHSRAEYVEEIEIEGNDGSYGLEIR